MRRDRDIRDNKTTTTIYSDNKQRLSTTMYTKFGTELLVPQTRGCGCLSLRVGTIFTGILAILYSVLALGVGLAALQESPPSSDPSSFPSRLQWAGVGVVTMMLVHLVTLLLSALLLVGAITERAWMLRPWVVFKSAHVCVAVVVFVAGGVLRMRGASSHADQLLLTAAEFLSILVWVYMLMVVSSFQRQLEERRDERLRLTKLDDTWYTA